MSGKQIVNERENNYTCVLTGKGKWASVKIWVISFDTLFFLSVHKIKHDHLHSSNNRRQGQKHKDRAEDRKVQGNYASYFSLKKDRERERYEVKWLESTCLQLANAMTLTSNWWEG